MAIRVASKKEVVEHIVSGVAHEIRNPLSIIRLATEELQHILSQIGTAEELKKQAKDRIGDILQNVQRVTDISEQICQFTKKQNQQFTKLNLHSVMEDSIRSTKHLFPKDSIQLFFRWNATDPSVYGNGVQLTQVFVNLITNALEAIQQEKNGSKIFLETNSLDTGSVIVKVKDDGPGISKENLNRVFEPFFTTKRGKKNQGIGLALVADIIADHGGTIQASSEGGEGCEFIIQLPHDRRLPR